MALTIRPTDSMREKIEDLKIHFRERTSTKVIEAVIEEHMSIRRSYEKVINDLHSTQEELSKIKHVLREKRLRDMAFEKFIQDF